MLAVITSTGERTTQLCKWSLERNGFQVMLIKDDTSLAEKLDYIYTITEEDFVRIDADIIPNSILTEAAVRSSCPEDIWWVQYQIYDWFQQDTAWGGVQYIRKEALPALRNNIKTFYEAERPESQMYRLDEFHNPRRCKGFPAVMGLHGYGQTIEDIERAKQTKARRKQEYDWQLFERVERL